MFSLRLSLLPSLSVFLNVPRRGADCCAGASVGHGLDGTDPDRGLCVALEKQVTFTFTFLFIVVQL